MPRSNNSPHTESMREELARIPATVRLAFASFLGVPTIVVGIFLAVAVATAALDRSEAGWLDPVRRLLESYFFSSTEDTRQALATMAGGMLTVTSITFSLLLVALQQSAGSMTHAVFDQFLRRRLNQVYAGWFIGVTLYTLVILATVGADLNPIFGATLSLLLAISALYVLLLLIYGAIEQMQPSAILQSIHDHTLEARARQQPLLRRTRRHSASAEPVRQTVRAAGDGFIAALDLDDLAAALAKSPYAEIDVRLPIGAYVAFHDPLAEVRGADEAGMNDLAAAVQRAVRLERERDLDADPAFGIEQIGTIAWTAISTSKQDPSPGLEAARNLRDLLARWVEPAEESGEETDGEPLAVVYPDDVMERLMGTIESLAVVTTESMQHQVYAGILRGLATLLDRLPPPLARRAEEVVLRSLAGLGDHILSAELDHALREIADALEQAGLGEGAAAVRIARTELATSIGRLNSRSTRVPER
jgi:uncharacterized membrane protein